MTRIFLPLAVFTGTVLTAACVSGGVSLAQKKAPAHEDAYLVHFILGLSAVLCALLIHCLVMTYFLGTGRLVKEACLAYSLPDADLPRRTRDIKRSNTPLAIVAMLVTIAAAASGEADRHNAWPWWIHLVLVAATLAVNLWAFVVEYRNLRANIVILDSLFEQVERIRAERGLPPSAEVFGREGW
jgi:hypothetical protein